MASASDTSAMTGNWKASVRGNFYYFQFAVDSSMKIINGKDTTLARFSVELDSTSAIPLHIDLHVLDRQSGEVLYTNKGIFEWMGPDRMRLRWSENMRDRPLSFMPKGHPDVLLLIRQKP